MARPGARRYSRPTDSDLCAVPACTQPLDVFGARCRFHRVHGDEHPYASPKGHVRRDADHGEYLRYRRGCRCDLCRKANASRVASRKAAS